MQLVADRLRSAWLASTARRGSHLGSADGLFDLRSDWRTARLRGDAAADDAYRDQHQNS
jgi:hypothetical protein